MTDSIEKIAGEIDEAAVAYAGHHSSGTFRRLATRLRALSPAGGDWVMVSREELFSFKTWFNTDSALGRYFRAKVDSLVAASPQQEPGAPHWGNLPDGFDDPELYPTTPADEPVAACPHIVQSKEGTAYCRLAESAGASGGGTAIAQAFREVECGNSEAAIYRQRVMKRADELTPASPAAVDGWRSIRSAPKTGTTLLLFCDERTGDRYLGFRPIDCPDDGACDTRGIACYPTHWQTVAEPRRSVVNPTPRLA